MWCVSRCFGRLLRGAFFFVVRFEVRGGSVLSALYEVLAILSASYLAFLVGFRLTSALTFSLSTILLYIVAQRYSIDILHKYCVTI